MAYQPLDAQFLSVTLLCILPRLVLLGVLFDQCSEDFGAVYYIVRVKSRVHIAFPQP